MTTWPPISRDHLKNAAKDAAFDTTLPLLIRRLIAETSSELTEVDMPGGSGVASGGFDGVTVAQASSAFVPAGTTVWELSVGGGNKKAENDYAGRLQAPHGLQTKDVTYIEVILEPWNGARAFAACKTLEQRWLAVRGYNLDRVHAWLDDAPATTAWLAGQLGLNIPGVDALGTWWEESWLPSTRVPLDAEIVLAGRDGAAADLLKILATGQGLISLGGDLRHEEMRAFIATSVMKTGPLESSALAARTLFVSDPHSLAQLVAQRQPLVLVLPDARLLAGLPSTHPHQLIVPAPPRASGHLEVPLVHSQIAAERLEAAGLPREQASRYGNLARRSLLAVQRSLAHNPVLTTPSWATAPDLVRRRLLLAGSWDAGESGDREIVASLVGLPYEQLQEAAVQLAAAPELPFISEIDGIWHLMSVDDAWELLANALTHDDLQALASAVRQVFTERDPVLELDRDDRWKAGISGVRKRFSDVLRTGLAQSLALLGASGDAVCLRGGVTGAEWVGRILHEIFEEANADATYRLWESLGPNLSLLAEASPAAFLNTMRVGMAAPSPLHRMMFTDSDKGPFGFGRGSVHTNFLWALEMLAWSPEEFEEAVGALAALADIDPGGTWSNRPASSLVGVFSAWAPNTRAPVSTRATALRRMGKAYPQVVSRLLLDLIPNGRGFQTVHAGPRFRDWDIRSSTTFAELDEMVDAVVDLLFTELSDDPASYLPLVGKLDVLAKPHREQFIEKLQTLAEAAESPQKYELFEALRAKVAHHKQYSDTIWALPDDDVIALQTAAALLRPADPALLHGWLFKSFWPEVGDRTRRDDHVAYEADLLARRTDALEAIYAHGGLEAVAGLADSCDYPGAIGFALAGTSVLLEDEMVARLDQNESRQTEVAFAYLKRRLQPDSGSQQPDSGSQQRLDDLLNKPDKARSKARILRMLSQPSRAWEILQSLSPDVSDEYWQEFVYVGLGHDFEDGLTAAWALLDAERPSAALDLIYLYSAKHDTEDAAELVAAAMEKLLKRGLGDPEFPKLSSSCFQQLFSLLARHRESVGAQRLVSLEWQFYPALGFDANAPTMHDALVREPTFFAELVGYLCPPATTSDGDPETPSEVAHRRQFTFRAYDVLNTFRNVPGVNTEGQLDGSVLRDWIEAARAELVRSDRLDVGDEHIGRLLAFAPPGSDGSPIHHAVCELLEDYASDDLDRGLTRGIADRRGGTSRGLLEGGAQEWQLAEGFRSGTSTMGAWPRARRVLLQLAKSYEAQARREDQEAERRHRGLDF